MSQLEALKFSRRPKTMALVQTQDLRQLLGAARGYWLTRFVILRLLGFIYAIAFLVAANQLVPLIGEHGLLPLGLFLDRVRDALGSSTEGFLRLPSLFWINHSDSSLVIVSWIGFALSCVVVAGYANAILLALLWILYMSIVHVGQDWYSYGWEIQLLETGFLAIFLCPLLDRRPFPSRARHSSCSGFFDCSFSNHARLRPHQTPRRSRLARSHRALLSLRNPADPQSVQPLVSLLLPQGVLKFGRCSIISQN